MTKIDVNTDDGTISNDKVIFIYPIFTTGKDNNNDDKANNVVRISDSLNGRYFSRVDGEENKTYFYYNNLVINGLSSWSLSFAGRDNIGGWYSTWGDNRDDSSYKLYNKDDKTKSVIKENGVYNVYVYLQRGSIYNHNFDNGAASNSEFAKKITSSLIPLSYDEDSFAEEQRYKVWQRTGVTVGRYFWMFVKVERVYEFRLAGTEGRGFTFDTAGQLYVSHFSSSNDASLGGLWKMYYLDNVFMEKGKNNLFTEYTNSTGGKYKAKNTVFSFLPSDENLSTISGILPMNSAELQYVNDNEPDSNVGEYLGISTSSFRDIKDNPRDYIKEPENLPNYVPGNDYANYFFASEFKYSGFCKVLIKVDFATSGDYKGKPTFIRVAVAPYLTNVHKVYVYPDETDLVSFIDPDTKLIDPENNTTLKATELTSFEMKANDDYVLNDQEITLKDGSKMMLSAYLTQYDVVDHLTNKKIEIGKSYKRHMACWQRVKIS